MRFVYGCRRVLTTNLEMSQLLVVFVIYWIYWEFTRLLSYRTIERSLNVTKKNQLNKYNMYFFQCKICSVNGNVWLYRSRHVNVHFLYHNNKEKSFLWGISSHLWGTIYCKPPENLFYSNFRKDDSRVGSRPYVFLGFNWNFRKEDSRVASRWYIFLDFIQIFAKTIAG